MPDSRTAPFSEPGKQLERVVFFSDAVFAIAITLLSLELKIAPGPAPFWERLGQSSAKIFGFIITFAIVGTYWWVHNRIFSRVRAIDGGGVALNLLNLALIAALPFPTALFSEHAGVGEVQFYAGTICLCGLAQFALWRYLVARGFVTDVTAEVQRVVNARLLATPIVFGASVLLAPFAPRLSIWSWMAMGPAMMLIPRVFGRLPAASRAAKRR